MGFHRHRPAAAFLRLRHDFYSLDLKKMVLPHHVEKTVQQIASMHVAHRQDATPIERFTDCAAAFVGRPIFLLLLAGTALSWIVLGSLLPVFGLDWFDHPPFPFLDLVLSITAIAMAVLILASQKRDDILANRREQMTLQIALLSEQKLSKLIELLEELRRDLPNVHNRVDLDAIELTGNADHVSALREIEGRSATDGT
jgi:uncharacterized membrane protein